MRVLVVTSMYPSPSRPGLGGFVRDQVEALRAIDGLEVELFAFAPGGGLPGAGTTRRAPVLPCGVNLDRFAACDRRESRTRWSAGCRARSLA